MDLLLLLDSVRYLDVQFIHCHANQHAYSHADADQHAWCHANQHTYFHADADQRAHSHANQHTYSHADANHYASVWALDRREWLVLS